MGFDSFNRLETLLDMLPKRRSHDHIEWFVALGEAWSTFDNIAAHRLTLARLLRTATRAELDAMMQPEDLVGFRSLPATMTVYRGCYAHNLVGLSWTLDPDIARKFVTLNRYRHSGKPILAVGRASRARCAFISDRAEREIICPTVRRLRTEEL